MGIVTGTEAGQAFRDLYFPPHERAMAHYSVASPNRETESMLDGSDAVADWPILNALVNTAGGASWVSLHHGGGVGMGYSIHAIAVTERGRGPRGSEGNASS